jgi:preprotein translocase subunit SecG
VFLLIAGIHIVLCIGLMGLVLLQHGKGADAGAVLGGGSDSLLGAGGASSVITKITTGLAIGFMVTSILLAKIYDQGLVGSTNNTSIMQGSLMGTDVPAVETPATETTKTEPSSNVENTASAPQAVDNTVSKKSEANNTK